MRKRRDFFCAVGLHDAGYMAIGGLSNNGDADRVEMSVEYKGDDIGLPTNIAPLITPRSGHGCTVLNTPDLSVLVSGGTKGVGHGESALAGVEIWNSSANIWIEAAPMNTGRFGHAVVTIGDKIIAVGGDTKVPSNILDTMEEYDIAKNSWKISEQKLRKPRANFGFALIPHSIFNGCVINE